MDMRTADMATGHMYVGGTVSEGLITLITMVRAFTRLGSLGMVLNSFHVFFNAPQKVSKVQTCTRIRHWVFLSFFSSVFIDTPEKLPKFGAFSTLGTALVLDLGLVGPLVGHS